MYGDDQFGPLLLRMGLPAVLERVIQLLEPEPGSEPTSPQQALERVRNQRAAGLLRRAAGLLTPAPNSDSWLLQRLRQQLSTQPTRYLRDQLLQYRLEQLDDGVLLWVKLEQLGAMVRSEVVIDGLEGDYISYRWACSGEQGRALEQLRRQSQLSRVLDLMIGQ